MTRTHLTFYCFGCFSFGYSLTTQTAHPPKFQDLEGVTNWLNNEGTFENVVVFGSLFQLYWFTLLFKRLLFSGSGLKPADHSAHSSSSSRGPLSVHNFWSDKPTGRGGIPQHHQHQQLSSDPDSYRENIPGAEFRPPHSREFKLLSAKPGGANERRTLRDVAPPLCASRLKPIRQKTKNAVVRNHSLTFQPIYSPGDVCSRRILVCFLQVSILDTGDVCMELLKCQGGQERVREVLHISCDGATVKSFFETIENISSNNHRVLY